MNPAHAAVARATCSGLGWPTPSTWSSGSRWRPLGVLAAEGPGPFDLVFIAAGKPSMNDYVTRALALSHVGTVIVIDNVVRGGAVADPASTDPNVVGMREVVERLATEPRVSTTAVQTVGTKGYDGFVLALVVR